MISTDGTVTEPEKMNLPLPDAPGKVSLSGLNHK